MITTMNPPTAPDQPQRDIEMRIKPGVYYDRKGRRVKITGLSDGWAYTSDLQWFYADTGQSSIKNWWFSDELSVPFRYFPCDYDLIEKL